MECEFSPSVDGEGEWRGWEEQDERDEGVNCVGDEGEAEAEGEPISVIQLVRDVYRCFSWGLWGRRGWGDKR